MKLSQYLLTIPDGDSVIAVGTVGRSVVRVPRDLWHDVEFAFGKDQSKSTAGIPDELVKDLQAATIIVDDKLDELSLVRTRSFVARASKETFGLIIVPTMACNMGCHYCFESKPERDDGISTAVEMKISDFVSEKLQNPLTQNFHLRWFGGEPTLEIKKVVRITKMIRNQCSKKGKVFRADIISNGFTLDRANAMRLSRAGVAAAQVTFEGSRRKHDKIRRTKSMGSYDAIVDNILASGDIMEFSGRVHVAPYSLNTIPDLLHDLHRKGLHEILKSIYFAPLFNYKQGKSGHQFSSSSPLYLNSQDFAEHEVSLLELSKKLGFSILDPLDVDYGVCTALRENTAVMNTDGSLTKCYLDAGDNSEVFGGLSGQVGDENNVTKWRESDFTTDNICSDCKFAPVCLGGCTKHSAETDKKDMICTSLKYNFDKIIPLYYDQ